jgi:hypothetical protein
MQHSFDHDGGPPLNLKLDRMGKKLHNPEFTDPTLSGTKDGLLDEKDGRSRTLVGGLRNKVVVVFRKEDAKDIASVLAGF